MSDALRNFLAKCIVSPRPDDEGFYSLSFERCSKQWLEHMDVAIPAPPEPRTGRLGLNEADTKATAKFATFTPGNVASLATNAAITMCREDVAEWDAADNAEPDTLTVTLPLNVVRQAVEAWAGSPCPTWVGRVGDACRAALTEAGLE